LVVEQAVVPVVDDHVGKDDGDARVGMVSVALVRRMPTTSATDGGAGSNASLSRSASTRSTPT
jgi:hypothetical protein